MSQRPLVSVGVPVYNMEHGLRRALGCLVGQTYDRLEIIVCDNASTDGTPEVCGEFARADSRVRIVRHETNIGVGDNFRAACLKATGKYFFWAAADDEWEPAYVERLVEALEASPGAVVAQSGVRRVFADGEEHGIVRFAGAGELSGGLQRGRILLEPLTATRQKKYNLFVCGMFRREPLARLMRDFDTGLGERVLLAALVLDAGFAQVDEVLMVKRLNRERFSKRNPDDPYAAKVRDRGRWRFYGQAARCLFASPCVSARAKMTSLPALAAIVVALTLGVGAKVRIMALLPASLADRLRALRRRMSN